MKSALSAMRFVRNYTFGSILCQQKEEIVEVEEFKLFSTKISTWGSPITMRAYDEEDAEELARMLFKVPSDVGIIATEEIEEEK